MATPPAPNPAIPEIVIVPDPQSADHPVLHAVRDYWHAKRGARLMPSRRDVNPADIKWCLPQVLLVDVLPGEGNLRYRLLGSRLRPYFPQEATGRLMRDALAPFGEYTVTSSLAVYQAVVSGRTPLRITGPGGHFAQASKFFEAMLMPLSDDGETVNMIFGAFEFDWVKPEMK